MNQIPLFYTPADHLDGSHYLGSKGARGRWTYEDEHGVMVFGSPAARRIPPAWLELTRWCLLDGCGSHQCASAMRWLKETRPTATTVISYSDPSVGHTGALYRACNWVWAPTWHVLREPPTGAGTRGGKTQRAKHRWVYLLRPDSDRQEVLRLKDESLAKRYPWATYTEPKWKRGVPQVTPLAGRYKRWEAA